MFAIEKKRKSRNTEITVLEDATSFQHQLGTDKTFGRQRIITTQHHSKAQIKIVKTEMIVSTQ